MSINTEDKKYGKIIDVKEFSEVAKYLQSSLPEFHNDRIHTLMVYDE